MADDDWFEIPAGPAAGRQTEHEDHSQEPSPTVAGVDDWFAPVPAPPPVSVEPERTLPQVSAEVVTEARTGRKRRRGNVFVAGVAAGLVATGAAAWALLAGGSSHSAAAPAVHPAAPATAAAQVTAASQVNPQPWCVGRGPGSPVTVDNPDPGVAAIAGFESAYYAHDPGKAFSFIVDGAHFTSVTALTAATNALPADASACVLSTAIASGGPYAVDVYELHSSSGQFVRYAETVTTSTGPDGRTVITSITPRGGNN